MIVARLGSRSETQHAPAGSVPAGGRVAPLDPIEPDTMTKIRNLLHLGLSLGLIALVGCATEDSPTMEEMPSPSQAAEVTNENPTSPTIDVPATPTDEGAVSEPGGGVPAEDVTSEDVTTGTEESEEPSATEPIKEIEP
jgi:hypothetical protein